MINPVYTINLDISDYNLLALNDLMRMFVIQMIAQLLFFLRNDNVELFSTIFIESTLFIILGIVVYWLVFNNIIVFKNNSSTTDDNYYQSIYTKSI